MSKWISENLLLYCYAYSFIGLCIHEFQLSSTFPERKPLIRLNYSMCIWLSGFPASISLYCHDFLWMPTLTGLEWYNKEIISVTKYMYTINLKQNTLCTLNFVFTVPSLWDLYKCDTLWMCTNDYKNYSTGLFKRLKNFRNINLCNVAYLY